MSNPFYHTKQWQDCREAYMQSVGGLCEKCLKNGIYKPAEIVHHKQHLTPENVNDPSISLNFDNLEALCRDCHGLEHGGKRYSVDEWGYVTARD